MLPPPPRSTLFPYTTLFRSFSFSLGWFPSGGANSAGAFFDSELSRLTSVDFLFHLALPALTLALYLQGLPRSEEHTSELQSRPHLVCRLLLEKKKTCTHTMY